MRACEPNREDSEETLEEHVEEGINELPNALSKQSQSCTVRRKLIREAEVVLVKDVKIDDVSLSNEKSENQAGSGNEEEVFIPNENAQNKEEKEVNYGNQSLRINEAAAELPIDLLLCNGNPENEALRIKPSELPDAFTESSLRETEVVCDELMKDMKREVDVESDHNEVMKENNNTKTRKRKLVVVSFSDDDDNKSKKMKEITSYLRSRKQVMDVEKRVLRKHIEASSS